MRPGQASVFKPKEGRAQLCNTSVDVTKKQVFIKYNIFNRLLTSNSLKPKFCNKRSASDNIILSNDVKFNSLGLL
jgi:hypothetical protein